MPPHDINISWDPEMELAVVVAGCPCAECACIVEIIASSLEDVVENMEVL